MNTTKTTKFKIHWFVSTGAFHRNGVSFWKGITKLDDESAATIAMRDAQKFAASVGQSIRTFEFRHVLR